MSNNNNNTIKLLTIAFVVLKLVGIIGWSWWWVLSPVWIYLGLYVVVSSVAFLIFLHRNNKIQLRLLRWFRRITNAKKCR